MRTRKPTFNAITLGLETSDAEHDEQVAGDRATMHNDRAAMLKELKALRVEVQAFRVEGKSGTDP